MRIEVSEHCGKPCRCLNSKETRYPHSVEFKEMGITEPGVYEIEARKLTLVKRAVKVMRSPPVGTYKFLCGACLSCCEEWKTRCTDCGTELSQTEVSVSEVASGMAGPLVTEEEEPAPLIDLEAAIERVANALYHHKRQLFPYQDADNMLCDSRIEARRLILGEKG